MLSENSIMKDQQTFASLIGDFEHHFDTRVVFEDFLTMAMRPWAEQGHRQVLRRRPVLANSREVQGLEAPPSLSIHAREALRRNDRTAREFGRIRRLGRVLRG